MIPKSTIRDARSSTARVLAAAFSLLSCISAPASAQTRTSDLANLTLDQLVTMEVTSVSKREQKLSEAPSAIVVVTSDDIRRSGSTTVAEVLRTVPGLQVARVTSNKWAVSARGSNGLFTAKMLVLVDGRSVYTPLFSGVYWDTQDIPLLDIERIEVVRGPGATMWGANAVNGVINIITKSAADTVGPAMSVTRSTDEQVVGEFRYGAKLSDRANVRLFVKHAERGTKTGPAPDDWDLTRSGARLDVKLSPDDSLLVEGDGYTGSVRQAFGPDPFLHFYATPIVSDTPLDGAYALGRWTHAISSRAETTLQAYVDHASRSYDSGDLRNTIDLDFENHLKLGRRHDVVWGSGYRSSTDHLAGDGVFAYTTNSRTDGLFNGFAQDEVSLAADHLRVSGGLKIEHNAYTGWEWQPNIRAIFLISKRQSIWGAVSRAVRTPSRVEETLQIHTEPQLGPSGIPFTATVSGAASFQSETLRAHELGYRLRPVSFLSVDIAAFDNDYHQLRTLEAGMPQFSFNAAGPLITIPLVVGNGMYGDTHGLESVVTIKPSSAWQADVAYTYLNVKLNHTATSNDTVAAMLENNSPSHQVRVHGSVDVLKRVELDGSVIAVGELPRTAVPSYSRIDLRAGWRVVPALTIAVGVRSLAKPTTPEFSSSYGEIPTVQPRSVYLSAQWHF